jgi:RNA polymerase sigma-70 factor, ECF subfamily
VAADTAERAENKESTEAGESRRIREGDYEGLRAELEKAVRRLCPPWLADRREDLVQAALLRMVEIERRALAAGEKNRELAPSYLWKVATTALIDEIRRLRRRQEVELGEEVERSAASGQAAGSRLMESAEIGAALRQCLKRMALARRLAVTLHLQGYPVAEAAPLLGWDFKKVYNLVHRGLGDLRGCLKDKGIEP